MRKIGRGNGVKTIVIDQSRWPFKTSRNIATKLTVDVRVTSDPQLPPQSKWVDSCKPEVELRTTRIDHPQIKVIRSEASVRTTVGRWCLDKWWIITSQTYLLVHFIQSCKHSKSHWALSSLAKLTKAPQTRFRATKITSGFLHNTSRPKWTNLRTLPRKRVQKYIITSTREYIQAEVPLEEVLGMWSQLWPLLIRIRGCPCTRSHSLSTVLWVGSHRQGRSTPQVGVQAAKAWF